MTNRILAVLVVALVCSIQARGQEPQAPQPPPVFRVEVDAVDLDAFVTDANGTPVTDLTADEFEVFEDGVRQRITSFSQVNIPIERTERPLYSPTAIEPDVATNTGGEGRFYVIALDEVRPDLALRTRRFLRRFIEEQFAANDVGAVVYIGRGRASDAQDFTSNRRLLLNAIDKFSGGFPQEPTPASVQAELAGISPVGQGQQEFLLRARVRALRGLTEFMAGLRGRRKSMLYVTEQLGDVYGVLDYNGGARSLAFDDMHAAVTAATRGNVSIYPIDPRGLSPDGALGDAETAPEPGGAAEMLRIQELRALADATGGFAVVNTNSFETAFARIVRENSAYYVVGFTSTNDRRDGRFRRVEVRVSRPGVTVRTRAGYLAPRGRAPVEDPREPTALPVTVAASLGSPIATPDVPMRVFAAPYKGADRNAAVAIAVELDTDALGLVERDGLFTGDLAIATSAIAAEGKVHPGERHQAALRLKPDTHARAAEQGLRVLSQMELPPGRYQLRVAGGTAQRAGSVVYDLEVPDFSREAVSMSGVSLMSLQSQGAPTVRPHDPLAGLLPGAFTATREFAAGDTLTLYTEVYEGRRNTATHTVSLKAELRTDDGRVVTTLSEERSSTELKNSAGGYGFLAQVPLTGVEPGLYVIHVEGRVNMGDRPAVSRDIQIRVR